MKLNKIVSLLFILLFSFQMIGQKTITYTNSLKDYNKALSLYNTKSYVASQQLFNTIKSTFEDTSELKANCEYYAANCAVRLGQHNADDLMQNFVDNYPTSTKRNDAFLEVADYYFKHGKYAYALKWYERANSERLSISQKEDYHFKLGYAFFATRNYKKAKNYFSQLLDSQKYGSQAKYYYGYIAYQEDDFDTADDYLGQVVNDANYNKNVSYYLSDMNFKLGKFQKSIDLGLPLLETSNAKDHSELSKIIGESYFNLNQYPEATPHLKNYKGKRGKWNNTDYYLLGYSYYKQNDYPNAIANFNKIINGNNSVAQNAYYHLAECYLKSDQKTEALNAFRNASQMDFENDLKEDAWLNYAKLSYEIGNPYKSVPDVLQDYLKEYPKSNHTSEIKDLIISAFVTSKDYKGALNYLDENKREKDKALYQKIAFLRGVELFNNGNYSDAKQHFKISLKEPEDLNYVARATYWKGESNYRLTNFNDALTDYLDFSNNNNRQSTEEHQLLNYNLGYTYFKLKEYPKAIASFTNYIQENNENKDKLNDSYLRLADSYFVSSNYPQAIVNYEKVILSNGNDTDYASFQKAICYGFTNQDDLKIDGLNSFKNRFQKSTYLDDALYVLGNTYVKNGDNTKALENYNTLISNHKRSSLVSKSMLKKGIIFYNTDQNNKSLHVYKNIVDQFPNTPEANQAIANARQVYIDLNRVDEYAAWVKNIDFANVTDAQLDNDLFEAAEKQYLQGNHSKAITGFKKYLRNFTNGLHQLQANFYLGEALYSEKNITESENHYRFIIEKQTNEFTEPSLAKLSQVYLELNKWQQAIPVLERLETESNLLQNIVFAQRNLMKGYFNDEQYSKAVIYAEKVLNQPKTDNTIKSDAKVIIARAAIKTNDLIKARKFYKELENIASGELKAESIYYDALFEHQDGSYRVSNQKLQTLVADYAAYKFWGAKGLIIMAKNFYELDDAYQATYILESVIKNFTEFEDVTDEAKTELEKIKLEEAKTNDSVNPKN